MSRGGRSSGSSELTAPGGVLSPTNDSFRGLILLAVYVYRDCSLEHLSRTFWSFPEPSHPCSYVATRLSRGCSLASDFIVPWFSMPEDWGWVGAPRDAPESISYGLGCLEPSGQVCVQLLGRNE